MSGIVYFFPSRHLTNWWWLLFSRSVVSSSLQPRGLQHASLLCPSLSPRVHSNSRPWSRWCHLTILCCPLLLLPSVFLSIRVFSCESALRIRWPKYWNFSFSISPSNEYSWLISFRLSPVDVGIWVFSSRIFSMGMCTNKQRRFYKNGIVIDRLFWTFFSHSVICWEHLSLLINIGL